MRQPSIWRTLGISRTQDRTEIRRAYAKKLKVTNPEDDPEGFEVLRSAYEQALNYIDVRNGNAPATKLSDDDTAKSLEASAATSREHLKDTPLTAGDTPSPVLSELAMAYNAACEHLETTLNAHSLVDDNERLEALFTVLSAPALGLSSERQRAEIWLTKLITENQPQSDILIASVVTHFGWASSAQDDLKHSNEPYKAPQWILDRARDIAFLKRIKKPDTHYHYAYSVLSQPRQRESLGSRLFSQKARGDIREFLDQIRRSHPDIEAGLNAEVVALWERRLERPAFSGVSSWMAALSLPCLLVMTLAIFFLPEAFGAALLFCFMPPLWTCCWLIGTLGFALPRLWWSKQEKLRANPWLAFGWGPTLIVVLFLAALPPSTELMITVAALSSWVAWWAVTTGEPDRNSERWAWSFRLAFNEIFLVLWSLVMLGSFSAGAAWQIIFAMMAAAIVSGFGRMPLLSRWNALTQSRQKAVLITLIGLAATAIVVLWLCRSNYDQEAIAVAIGATAVLLHRVPTLKVQSLITPIQSVTILGTIFVTGFWTDDNVIPTIGSIILGWAVLSCVISLKSSPEDLQE